MVDWVHRVRVVIHSWGGLGVSIYCLGVLGLRSYDTGLAKEEPLKS